MIVWWHDGMVASWYGGGGMVASWYGGGGMVASWHGGTVHSSTRWLT
jgi:hypothetical protein